MEHVIEYNLDSLFEEAARLVVETQIAAASLLQENLYIGFNRSNRILTQLEETGIVGPKTGAKPREVLVKDISELEPVIKSILPRN